jgi:hypothetical protein
MINEWETNRLFVSDLLALKMPAILAGLRAVLQDVEIETIPGTKDIWSLARRALEWWKRLKPPNPRTREIEMSVRTIESVVNIAEDRQLVLQLPADILPGQHRVVAMLDQVPDSVATEVPTGKPWTFPILANAQWPDDMPLSRAEMYGDDGR